MHALPLIETVCLASLAGVLLGVIGGGGGGLYVILLTFALRLPVERAIGTALALSTITALAGAIGHWRSGNVERRCALYLGTSGVIGAAGGALVIQYLSPTLLKLLMAVVFVSTGLLSLVRLRRIGAGDAVRSTCKSWLLVPAGGVSGFVSGAFGLSGATPLSSFLVSFGGLSPPMAVGTTLTSVLATSLVGATVHYCRQRAIDFTLVLILGIGSVAGAYFGAKLTSRVNKKVLAITLAVLTVAFGVYVALHTSH